MRSRQIRSKIPQVNLVPMIDVLMSVLTFFVIMAMNMTGNISNVVLPELATNSTSGNTPTAPPGPPPPTLTIGLDATGQIVLNDGIVELSTLKSTMAAFLTAQPEGIVKVSADRGLKYQDIEDLLMQLAEVGGDRVLLVVQK